VIEGSAELNLWDHISFTAAATETSAGNRKIPQSEFLPTGPLPVIDQGSRFVAGYTNDLNSAYAGQLPVIVFGDHTRNFKFVDFPFAIGADGVKVLQASTQFHCKFLYHFLSSLDIPSAGYSRHFKFLRELEIPRPPMSAQKEIASILDRASTLIAKRRQAVSLLGDLAQSIFFDMFGRAGDSGGRWKVVPLGEIGEVQGGLQVTSKRNSLPVEVPYLRVANVYRNYLDLDEIKKIRLTERELERTALEKGDLLVVEGHGNPNEIGRVAMWDGSVSPCVHQNHLIRVRMDSRAIPAFMVAALNSPEGRLHLLRSASTTSGLNTISTSDVRTTPVILPPLERQAEYVKRIAQVEQTRLVMQGTLSRLDELFASLQAKAFRGGL
jgi:type I restriction enzyme, S subunit